MSKNLKLLNHLMQGVASVAVVGAVASLVPAVEAHAQDYTTGTLRAVVQNEAGTPVAGASVLITSPKGVRRSVTSGADGKLLVPQLPIGSYTVTIEMNGYAKLVADNVAITTTSGAVTFTIDSMDDTVEEIYVVGTRRAGYDFNSTTTGLSVNVGELFEKTPIGRDATSVALLAPGTGLGDSDFATGQYGSSGANASIGGSSVGENAFYVNGLNVTNFRNMIGGSTIPFEFYDFIEVKTGGYQAEFGRSTGGVINAVTKSGSNELHFGANVFWEPNSMRSDSPVTFASRNDFDRRENIEYNFWASGAIVEDKLFFYGLYNPRSRTSLDCGNTRCTEITRDDPFYGLKLDFVPFDGHRLEYTYFSDSQDADYVVSTFAEDQPTGEGLLIGESAYHNGGDNHIYKYTGAFTDWFTLSAMYGLNKYERSRDSADVTPSILEFRDGSGDPLGSNTASSFSTGTDTRKAFRIDGDFYFNAVGEHHIRVGYDREKLNATENTRYAGYAALRYYNSGTSSTGQRVRIRQYWNEGDFSTIQSAFYIQDSWKPLDNLTLNIGYRNESFENKNADGDVFTEMKNQNALRLGFSWDPMNDGKNKVYGSWGRYFLPVATNTNIRMAGREFYIQQYYELPAGWDGSTPYLQAERMTAEMLEDHLQNGTPLPITAVNGDTLTQIGSTSVYSDGKLKGTLSTTDFNLKPMYQDELIAGFEHSFDNGWSVGVRYVHRNLGRLIEDVAIDAAVNAWAAENGLNSDVYSGFHQYVLTNPGNDMTIMTDGILDANGDPADQVVTFSAESLGYPVGKRTYDAIDITFNREWDGKWALQGSYTWSKSQGNTEGTVKSDNGQDDAGLTTDYDQPGFTDGAYGYLPNDRRHRFKVWGSYALTDWMTVGGKFTLDSPRKMGCLGEHPTDVFAWYYGAISWYCGAELTPRGSQMETDWQSTLDLSFSVTPWFVSDIPGDLNFRVDVFNVFNSKAVIDRWEYGEYGFTSDLVFGGTTLADADPDYGKPTSYQSPRRVRISATWKF